MVSRSDCWGGPGKRGLRFFARFPLNRHAGSCKLSNTSGDLSGGFGHPSLGAF